jgi:hypothetical protein
MLEIALVIGYYLGFMGLIIALAIVATKLLRKLSDKLNQTFDDTTNAPK